MDPKQVEVKVLESVWTELADGWNLATPMLVWAALVGVIAPGLHPDHPLAFFLTWSLLLICAIAETLRRALQMRCKRRARIRHDERKHTSSCFPLED